MYQIQSAAHHKEHHLQSTGHTSHTIQVIHQPQHLSTRLEIHYGLVLV